MSALIGLFVGGWIWIDTGNMLSGVMAFLMLWFIFGALGAVLGLFTSKEGGAVVGLLAIFGLGFLLGGDDDCDL